MPNDAKLGLVVGMGLVIAVAVLFFHKEGPVGSSASEPAPAGIVRPIPPAPLPSGPIRTASARTTARTTEVPAPPAGARRHTVKPGDTLFSLARWYYGDAEKFGAIYQANRGILLAPDPLPVGADLVIPEL
jgi:5'-nucleotidase / UDP-sugar diphosphatase